MTGRAPSAANCRSISQTSCSRFFLVRFHGLLVDQLVDRGIAVAGIIPFRAAHVVLVKLLVRVIDAAPSDIEPDGVILTHDPRIPLSGVHRFEHTVDVDLL